MRSTKKQLFGITFQRYFGGYRDGFKEVLKIVKQIKVKFCKNQEINTFILIFFDCGNKNSVR